MPAAGYQQMLCVEAGRITEAGAASTRPALARLAAP